MQLNLTIYTPSHFILGSKMEKYAELYQDNKVNVGFTQASREQGIRRLTAINLMKRMESSVYSFALTLNRIMQLIDDTIHTIDAYDKNAATVLNLTDISNIEQFEDVYKRQVSTRLRRISCTSCISSSPVENPY